MKTRTGIFVAVVAALLGWISGGPRVQAQDQPEAGSPLAEQQQQVAQRYRRLEELLLRLADVEAEENAERAALLRQAAKQSREMFVLEKLNNAGQSLRSAQFQNALQNQASAKEGLDRLLTLLLSEDRPRRIRDEKDRVDKMIKELKLVERLQRSTRARTENGLDLDALGEEQQRIAQRAEKVRESMRDDEGEDAGAAAEDAGEPTPGGEDRQAAESERPAADGDSPPTDPQPGDAEAEGGKPTDSPSAKPADADQPMPEPGDQPSAADSDATADDSKPADAQPNDADASDAKPAEGQPSPDMPSGEPSESGEPSDSGEPSESPPSQPSQPSPGDSPAESGESSPAQQTPGSPEQQAEQQLQRAIENMRQAREELERSQREDAVDQQRQAEENLRAAIDRLEKILRQLREEEMQRELARLEARLRKMAQMQSKLLDDTKLLDSIPVSQRDRQFDVRAGNLAFEEKKIVMEADRALLLLREEGSSVAFPEVVAQIRDDMERVAQRLTGSKVDAVTIGIQEDILAALEEMIAALQKAQRDLEQQRQQEQPPSTQPGQSPGDQPLVEQIAELKLIRTMETRILATTQRYTKILDEAGDAADLLPLVRDLAERQGNLYRITRDIVQKRNE